MVLFLHRRITKEASMTQEMHVQTSLYRKHGVLCSEDGKNDRSLCVVKATQGMCLKYQSLRHAMPRPSAACKYHAKMLKSRLTHCCIAAAGASVSSKYLFICGPSCLEGLHIFLRPGLKPGRAAANLLEEDALLAE